MSPLRSMQPLAVLGLLVLVAACTQQAPAALPAASPAVSATRALSPAPTSEPILSTSTPASSPSAQALYTPTEPPPRVDVRIASVAPEDVVFDTFRGGYVPLSVATEGQIESLRDVIKPVYEPRYDGVEGGKWLDDDDLVIGYATESGAYAYPVKILNLHEIVNDFIDGVPVLVSYCPLCASGVVYDRELDGQVLLFGNTGALYQSDMVMYDHQTGSYWFQVAGEAIVGPLTGKRITMLPSMTTTWGEWKGLHPRTSILSKDLGLLRSIGRNPYDRDPFVGYAERVAQERFVFPVSEDKLDRRINAGEMVFAVQVGESHKAYPRSGEGMQVVNDVVDGHNVVVITRDEGVSVSAYYSEANSRTLSFSLSNGSVQDVETKSVWNDAGLAVSGPMAGAQLSAVPSRTSFWFSLVGAFPDIEIYQGG